MSQALVLTLDSAGEPIFYGDNVECAGAEGGSRAVVAQRFEDRGSKALQEGISEVKWINQRHRITEAAMERRLIAGREEVQDLLSNLRSESAASEPEGVAQFRAAAILDFGPDGLRDWTILWTGEPFSVRLDLAEMRGLCWEMNVEEATVVWTVWPEQFELKSASAVSEWIPFSHLIRGQEVVVSQDKLRSCPLDEFMFRAKISEAKDGFEVVIQWLFGPEKVESWEEVETSWVEAGVLAKRPLMFLGTKDELAEKFEVDFLPFVLRRRDAKVSDLSLRLGIHYVAAGMAGGESEAGGAGSITWAHRSGHRLLFAKPLFRAVFPWKGQNEAEVRMQELEGDGAGSRSPQELGEVLSREQEERSKAARTSSL